MPRPQINGIIKGLTIVACCCFCQMRYLNKLLTIKMVNKAHVPIQSFIAIFAVSGLNRSFSRPSNEKETFAHAYVRWKHFQSNSFLFLILSIDFGLQAMIFVLTKIDSFWVFFRQIRNDVFCCEERSS